MPRIQVPDSVDDSIDYGGDVDTFSVRLEAGESYSFDVFGDDFLDSTLTLYQGGRVDPSRELAFSDDFGGTLDPHIDFVADRSGIYTLAVEGYGGFNTGEYTLETDYSDWGWLA
jgi:hypothetical protein